jgi:hypothetical protein
MFIQASTARLLRRAMLISSVIIAMPARAQESTHAARPRAPPPVPHYPYGRSRVKDTDGERDARHAAFIAR